MFASVGSPEGSCVQFIIVPFAAVVQGRRKWLAVEDRTKREEKGGPDCSMVASLHLSSLKRSHVCAHVALMASIEGSSLPR